MKDLDILAALSNALTERGIIVVPSTGEQLVMLTDDREVVYVLSLDKRGQLIMARVVVDFATLDALPDEPILRLNLARDDLVGRISSVLGR